MGAYWNGGFSSVFFNFQPPQPCQVCNDPENIVMKAEKLIELLEDSRKITHPDRCEHKDATEVTARINACITEIRLRKRGG